MASDDVGLSPVPSYDNPDYKRHPNNTKKDQLPTSEVITGLPRPDNNIVLLGISTSTSTTTSTTSTTTTTTSTTS